MNKKLVKKKQKSIILLIYFKWINSIIVDIIEPILSYICQILYIILSLTFFWLDLFLFIFSNLFSRLNLLSLYYKKIDKKLVDKFL